MHGKSMTVSDKKEVQDNSPPVYDDDTIERMKRYYKVETHDELLKFIKTHGMRRHVDLMDESKEP